MRRRTAPDRPIMFLKSRSKTKDMAPHTCCEMTARGKMSRRFWYCHSAKSRTLSAMVRQSRDLHVAHMQAIEQIENRRTLVWNVALAGLAALRLVDAWVECEGHLPRRTGADVENDPDWIGAAELAVQLIQPGVPVKRVLQDLVNRTVATVGRGDAVVLMHLLAYADHLRRESIWPPAIDAYQAVIRHARDPQEL